MRAVLIYRALLLVRVGWLLLEWFFGWDSRRHVNSFTLLHPYAALFAHAAAEFTLFVVLAGLWYFRRWARLLFVLALVLSVVDSAFWPLWSIAAAVICPRDRLVYCLAERRHCSDVFSTTGS